MSTLTIRIDSKLERDLARLAKAQKKTKSEIAREMLRRHMLVRDLNDIRASFSPTQRLRVI